MDFNDFENKQDLEGKEVLISYGGYNNYQCIGKIIKVNKKTFKTDKGVVVLF